MPDGFGDLIPGDGAGPSAATRFHRQGDSFKCLNFRQFSPDPRGPEVYLWFHGGLLSGFITLLACGVRDWRLWRRGLRDDRDGHLYGHAYRYSSGGN